MSDDHLAEPWPFSDDAPPDDAPPAAVEDAAQANRWLRRLRAIEGEMAEANEVADAEVAMAEAFRAKRLDTLGRAAEWVRRSLEGWMRAQVPERTTVQLPAGTIGLRKNPDKLVVPAVTSAVAAEALSAHGVTVTHDDVWKVPVADAKKVLRVGPKIEGMEVDAGYDPHVALSPDGEVVPGCVFLMAQVKRCEIKTASPAPDDDQDPVSLVDALASQALDLQALADEVTPNGGSSERSSIDSPF